MWRLREESKWKFKTSESGGVGVSVVVAIQAGGGAFYAIDPAGGLTQFNYKNVGVGAGLGYKVGGSLSTKDLKSYGTIWMLNTFGGKELQAADLTGGCMFTDFSGGMPGGGGGLTAMVLGITLGGFKDEFIDEIFEIMIVGSGFSGGVNSSRMTRLAVQNLRPDVLNSAKAVLLMYGQNIGQFGASAVGGFGLVWQGDVEALLPIELGIPSDPQVIRQPSQNGKQELKLIIPSDALFDFDKDTIGTKRNPDAARRLLAKVANIIRAESAYRIILIGYTDSIGKAKYNQDLSERRANNVRKWLVVYMGIKPERFLSVSGEGESSPVAPNNNPKGRAKNRRVEITLVPR